MDDAEPEVIDDDDDDEVEDDDDEEEEDYHTDYKLKGNMKIGRVKYKTYSKKVMAQIRRKSFEW